MNEQTHILEVRGLSKTFPGGHRALDRVSLRVGRGEILAIVGQNGSGKSTLIKVLAGFHDADPGASILVRGKPFDPGATAEGLHFIHQDLALAGGLTTVENLRLVRDGGLRAWRPFRAARERREARELLAGFGASFPVDVPVEQLSPAEQAIVAIARALDGWSREDNLLVLDEPTAALHEHEVRKLLDAVRGVAARGAGVIFVSHRLDEVRDLADRVVVLRDGAIVADVERGRYERAELIRHMIGEELDRLALRQGADQPSGDPLLKVAGLTGEGLVGVDLEVYAGEVVGVAGLVGSGMESLNGAIFGATRRAGGEVSVAGTPVRPGDPSAAVAAGLGFVPSDRKRDAALMNWTLRENLTLPDLGSVSRSFSLRRSLEARETRHWIEEVDVRPRRPEHKMAELSGGNQQKVVIARWLRTRPSVLLLDEPTQGVDIGAQASIHELLAEVAAGGTALVVSSSNVKELVDLCDRVLVMHDGTVSAELARAELSEQRLVSEALGAETATGAKGVVHA